MAAALDTLNITLRMLGVGKAVPKNDLYEEGVQLDVRSAFPLAACLLNGLLLTEEKIPPASRMAVQEAAFTLVAAYEGRDAQEPLTSWGTLRRVASALSAGYAAISLDDAGATPNAARVNNSVTLPALTDDAAELDKPLVRGLGHAGRALLYLYTATLRHGLDLPPPHIDIRPTAPNANPEPLRVTGSLLNWGPLPAETADRLATLLGAPEGAEEPPDGPDVSEIAARLRYAISDVTGPGNVVDVHLTPDCGASPAVQVSSTSLTAVRALAAKLLLVAPQASSTGTTP